MATRLPSDDLARLASTLHDVAEHQRRAPEPADKAHQGRVPRLRRFDQRQAPPIRLEYAIYALQRARDDAATSTDLAKLTRDRMRPEDVESLLGHLERDGYVMRGLQDVRISGRGREARNEIERETDRVYFAPWPEIDAGWVRDRLEALTATLTPHPPIA